MYASIDVNTGKRIEGLAHFRQSVACIIATPLVSRLMRRLFGSEVFNLVDAGFNATNRARLYAAIAQALIEWEPRLHLTRVQIVASDTPGQVFLYIDGSVTMSGQTIHITSFEVNAL